MKQSKPPPDLPEVQDWCCMRGDPTKVGVLLRYSWDTQWAEVAWASEVTGPRFCHRYELRRIKDQPPLTGRQFAMVDGSAAPGILTCKVCGAPIATAELCATCAVGNDPFSTSKFNDR